MKVSELMTSDVKCCGNRTNLAEVAEILWRADCGAVPVVDERRRVVGMLTDRDICIALGTRNRRPSEVLAEEVMSKQVHSCSPDDDVQSALAIMQAKGVLRLPVVGTNDKVVRGILSFSAVVRQASQTGDLSHANVLGVLKRLSESRSSEAVTAAAKASVQAQAVPQAVRVR